MTDANTSNTDNHDGNDHDQTDGNDQEAGIDDQQVLCVDAPEYEVFQGGRTHDADFIGLVDDEHDIAEHDSTHEHSDPDKDSAL